MGQLGPSKVGKVEGVENTPKTCFFDTFRQTESFETHIGLCSSKIDLFLRLLENSAENFQLAKVGPKCLD